MPCLTDKVNEKVASPQKKNLKLLPILAANFIFEKTAF